MADFCERSWWILLIVTEYTNRTLPVPGTSPKTAVLPHLFWFSRFTSLEKFQCRLTKHRAGAPEIYTMIA